ncbi:hypothetical protein [Azospirillum sp. B510]|uniref:hypothetical protein n=1 Tax=Azospirillum sp. (strain B510) TaxID=137722 RepID=UPI000310F441|nr:hypothetical protein [Azospirillum sp. B510]
MAADGMDGLRRWRDQAEEVGEELVDDRSSGEGDGDAGTPEPESRLPSGCPVVPLGVHGDMIFYLDELRQLRDLKAEKHSRLNVQMLFGRQSDLLYAFWPRKAQNKTTGEWETTGWRPELAAETLMAAAADKGVWSPQDRVRGAGAWIGQDGELVWHCGTAVLIMPTDRKVSMRIEEPGVVGELVYPAGPAIPRPHPEAQPAAERGPAQKLLDHLETWSWRRGDVDAHLMLGWIGAGMLGGALKWRPVAWITGGRGTGKSSLQDVIRWLMGSAGLLQSADPTPAGIRQTLRYDSLPVAIDEAEPGDDSNATMAGLVKLARIAASGGNAHRGGADHQANTFTLRSCLLFSSILIPPLLPQDRSRMAILELDELPKGATPPPMTEREIGELGRKLRRRLVDQWPRFAATLDAYRQAMREGGHSARGQDVFGTLLAVSDLLLYDVVPDEGGLKAWAAKLSAATLAELEGDVTDEAACLNHLLSTVWEAPHDRRRMTLGRWVGVAVGRITGDANEDTARKLLMEAGIKIHEQGGEAWLAVANMHRGLSRIYDSTQWAGRPGAQGGWVQALRRLPHKVYDKTMWFGVAARATLIPIYLCLPDGGSRPPNGPTSAGEAGDPLDHAVPSAPASPAGGASASSDRLL